MFLINSLFFCILTFFIFSVPRLKTRQSNKNIYLYGVPAVVGLAVALSSVLKIYFIYKITIFLLTFVSGLVGLWAVKGLFHKG